MQRGLSKDKRPDLNQVIVGIVMRRDGKPISHHIFSGNTVNIKAFFVLFPSLARRFPFPHPLGLRALAKTTLKGLGPDGLTEQSAKL